MGLYDNPTRMWFGTEQKMGWIETPQTGADVSSLGMSSEETLASGGGYVRNSWDSHKVYQFSWGDSATPSMVSLLQAYRNGSYGRGFLYFHDPMYYATNLLPKRWADPSMAANFEAEPLIPDVWPTAIPVASTSNNYPVNAASYPVPANYSSQANSSEHFIPIPEGMILILGAVYSGSARLYVRTPAGVTDLAPMASGESAVVNTAIRDQPWARIGIRKVGVAGSIVITGMTARLANNLPSGQGEDVFYTNLATAPSFEIAGGTAEYRRNWNTNPRLANSIAGWATTPGVATLAASASGGQVDITAVTTSPILNQSVDLPAAVGRSWSASIEVYVPPGFPPFPLQFGIYAYGMNSVIGTSPVVTIQPGQTVTVVANSTTPMTAAATGARTIVYGQSGPVGARAFFRNAMAEAVAVVGPYFDPVLGSGDSDFAATWTAAANNSASILSAPSAVTPITGYSWSSDGSDVCTQSSRWASSGSRSARISSRALVGAGSYRYIVMNTLPVGTYTAIATLRLAAPQVAPLVNARTLEYRVDGVAQGFSTPFPNAPGQYDVRLTFTKSTMTGTHLFLINQRVSQGDVDMWIDDFTLVEGNYMGIPFNGLTPGAVWNGPANASTSTLTSRAPVTSQIGDGPWMSGEGHSGCRFVGNPTVVNYNGVGGGQIGLSAMFKEVGAWA